MTPKKHIPVLLQEVLEFAHPACGESRSNVLDCTLGYGGHSDEILNKIPDAYVYGLDKDKTLLEEVENTLLKKYPSRFKAYNLCFSDLAQLKGVNKLENGTTLSEYNFILADLGISSIQLDDPDRGFSYKSDGPLDMRMDTTQELTAEIVLNTWEERPLFLVFAEGGVGSLSKILAKEVIARRPLKSTRDFKVICEDVFKRDRKRKKQGPSNSPATVPFQAIRIAVNNEFSSINELLLQSISFLAPGGCLAVISFHSLEDKLVARAMRWWSSMRSKGLHPEDLPLGTLRTRKAIEPSEEEVKLNSRSKSARMRVFQRNETPLWRERTFLP
jgi:16S rRNA (cytosine1402-N4)-methyltransferase